MSVNREFITREISIRQPQDFFALCKKGVSTFRCVLLRVEKTQFSHRHVQLIVANGISCQTAAPSLTEETLCIPQSSSIPWQRNPLDHPVFHLRIC